MTPSIRANPRNRKTPRRGRRPFFDSAIVDERFRAIERVVAWEDKFRRLLLRCERISALHDAVKTLARATITCGISAAGKSTLALFPDGAPRQNCARARHRQAARVSRASSRFRQRCLHLSRSHCRAHLFRATGANNPQPVGQKGGA